MADVKELIERLQLSSDWNCKEAATALSEMRGQLSTVLAREAATIERHDKKVAEMQEEIERLREALAEQPKGRLICLLV